MDEKYDVVVIGGGAAGLSAALSLTRARRRVLVIDSGTPRNAPAGHVHNYLGREGVAPADLLAAGRAEVTSYGGEITTGTVESAENLAGAGFLVQLDDAAGRRGVLARRLLVSTGLADELPDVPGLAQRWGRDVLHCPYCHGWEVRDQAIGVLGTGPFAAQQALLFRQWSSDVTLFRHTAPQPTEEELERLAARGIVVVDGEVDGLEVADDRLVGVRLRTGEVVARQALVVAPRFTARAGIFTSLGLTTVEQEMAGHVIGSYVPADPTGATAVAGVWVAGNVTDLRAQVINAAAAGLNAAAAINADLIEEDIRDAVTIHRRQQAHGDSDGHGTVFDEQFWEERYSSHTAVWSGHPNPQLVAEAAELAPGTALDVGTGEGADALWLASRGWRVSAVDFATAALKRGAAQAETLGADIAERIEWVHADLTVWAPTEERFDLVSAQFMHLPTQPRQALFARLAAAVAPGGTLLIVGHHPSDVGVVPRPPMPELFFTAEEIAESLDPERFDVLVTEARPRPATHPDGYPVTIRDTVLRAQRRR